MALKLSDLNDFLGPSTACTKPVESVASKGVVKIQFEKDEAKDALAIDKGSRGAAELPRATITLTDCLACSGCVTSAEAMLVDLQNFKEIVAVLEENKTSAEPRLVVCTVSPQSRASIAAKYVLTSEQAMAKLATFFYSIGVNVVLDAAIGRALSLLESQREFVDRFRNGGSFPMLASACPGWICYAEKTQGESVLPLISATRSAQQIMGMLVKCDLAARRGLKPERVYHFAVMQCLDKKLEASRSDFVVDDVRDVDCVITTGELEQMLQQLAPGPAAADAAAGPAVASASATGPASIAAVSRLAELSETAWDTVCGGKTIVLVRHRGGGSDGYLEHIAIHAAKELLRVELAELKYEAKRGDDFQECVVRDREGVPRLHFALAYGFRSIQNVVRKIKTGKCAYHFVEVMACPRGCLNGGGQLASPALSAPELLRTVTAIYNATPASEPEAAPDLAALHAEGRYPPTALLRTEYHAVAAADRPAIMQTW